MPTNGTGIIGKSYIAEDGGSQRQYTTTTAFSRRVFDHDKLGSAQLERKTDFGEREKFEAERVPAAALALV
jgi:hypothetical protein